VAFTGRYDICNPPDLSGLKMVTQSQKPTGPERPRRNRERDSGTYVARRLLLTIPPLLLVSVIVFRLSQLIQGDPRWSSQAGEGHPEGIERRARGAAPRPLDRGAGTGSGWGSGARRSRRVVLQQPDRGDEIASRFP
jgi:hypothetical protein